MLLTVPREVPAATDAERAQYDHARSLAERGAFGEIALEELDRYDRLYPEGRYLDDVHVRMARVEQALGREHRAAARLLEVVIVDAGAAREPLAREQLDKLLAGDRGLLRLRPRFEQAIERYRDERAAGPARRLAFVRALLLVDDDDARTLTAA